MITIDAVDAAAGTDLERDSITGAVIRNRRTGVLDTVGTIRRDQINHPQAILVSDINQMVRDILARAGSTGSTISRLRFFGHGSSGTQGLANSHSSDKMYSQYLVVDTSGNLVNRRLLAQLRGHFAPGAIVELHGCNVVLGHYGRQLLRQLADLWNVRVRGGAETQWADSADIIEGPTIEAYPVPGHSARVHQVR